MSEFINTLDVLGDDAVIDSIINRTITEFKDDRVIKVGTGAFYGCRALETIVLPNATVLQGGSFEMCSTLKSIQAPKLTKIDASGFAECTTLTSIYFPVLTTLINYCFDKCTALKTVDLPSLTTISQGVFNGCIALTTVILSNTSLVVSLANSNSLTNTPIASGTGYIYVPKTLVDSYKTATNWSVYANQIRALEDYTIDGTITGELDKAKI